MFRRAFPWSHDEKPPAEKVRITGEKVVLREKRIEDAEDDYAWRTDEELARLDATRPLHMRYDEFLRYSGRRSGTPTHAPSGWPSTRWTASTSATACTTTST